MPVKHSTVKCNIIIKKVNNKTNNEHFMEQLYKNYALQLRISTLVFKFVSLYSTNV